MIQRRRISAQFECTSVDFVRRPVDIRLFVFVCATIGEAPNPRSHSNHVQPFEICNYNHLNTAANSSVGDRLENEMIKE